jgi:hypothetical protein
MKYALSLGLLVTLALTMSACGGGGTEHQQAQVQAKGRPLPKYHQAVLPAGQYHTTEFKPPLSFRLTGERWRFEGPSSTLNDPEHSDYLFFQYRPMGGEGEFAFFNLRKVEGVYKPRGPTGAIESVPAPDELVGWFQHHPYLKTSKPEPVTVGGVKGVQFDVVTNLPKRSNKDGVGTFKLSTGGLTGPYYEKTEHYIILENVKGVPVVIVYNNDKDVFDEFVPIAEKVLKSVQWTDS